LVRVVFGHIYSIMVFCLVYRRLTLYPSHFNMPALLCIEVVKPSEIKFEILTKVQFIDLSL
jgi:hypothetical protein